MATEIRAENTSSNVFWVALAVALCAISGYFFICFGEVANNHQVGDEKCISYLVVAVIAGCMGIGSVVAACKK